MLYPKIHSLWKRQGWYLDEGKKKNNDYQKGRQSFIIGDYALPEFGNIKKWLVQEMMQKLKKYFMQQDVETLSMVSAAFGIDILALNNIEIITQEHKNQLSQRLNNNALMIEKILSEDCDKKIHLMGQTEFNKGFKS